MKILILLMLFCITSAFSQKLWEIQVNPNDLLRDVTEIPNSDLLLFTYNTGNLEIRRSEDGSLFKNVTTPQGELGSYSISGLGNSYYFSERAEYMKGKEDTYINDTIFVYDLFSDEIINRISFDIGDYKDRNNFMSKSLTYNITPDMTKVFGKVGYFFNNGPGDQYFYVYDINQQKILYTEIVNRLVISEHGQAINPGFYIDSYRSSPDSKYIILNGRDNGNGYNDEPKSGAKLFNVELNENSILMNIDNTSNDLLTVLSAGKFQSDSQISFATADIFKIYSFPSLNLLTDINVWSKSNFLISSLNSLELCNNNFVTRVYERKENQPTKYYKYFLKYNYKSGEIIFNSKTFQSNLDYCYVFTVDNCNKLIIDRDYDFREGVIACYNYNTLEVETQLDNLKYFTKTNSIINFNSKEFIGQLANIEIYNSTGNKVGTLFNGILQQPNYNIALPELSSGSYYLQCQLTNQNLNFNFVVVR